MKESEKKIINYLKYEAGEFLYDNIICSTYSIFHDEITTSEVDKKQSNLINNISKFNGKVTSR